MVTTLDDKGKVLSIRGTRCDGTYWSGHCDIVELSSDPTGQIDPGYPVYYHTGDGGSWVRYTADALGFFRTMWGRDTDGRFWATASFTSNLL